MRLLQKSDGFVDRVPAFDHMEWARFGGKGGIKGGIFAGEIDFPKDGGGGN
jgi:hypothetical protein